MPQFVPVDPLSDEPAPQLFLVATTSHLASANWVGIYAEKVADVTTIHGLQLYESGGGEWEGGDPETAPVSTLTARGREILIIHTDI